jgi:hypothetical protein
MATLQQTQISGNLTVTGKSKIGGQGFQGYYGYWRNNLTYNIDFTVKAGTVGHVWWVSAAYSHSGAVGGTFGYFSEKWYTRYNGGHHGLHNLHEGGNNSVAGSVAWSSPNTTQIRCTKNSGYYPGLGGCIIQVNGPLP